MQQESRNGSRFNNEAGAVAVVVEDDIDERGLIGAILEESDVQVIECESAEAAVTVMELVGDRAVFLLADVSLAGVMDGVDLACTVRQRWPHTKLVAIADDGDAARLHGLPKNAKGFSKPWRALDLIMEIERAVGSREAA